MIFYTLQGPSHELEIHDDKLLLKKKGWLRLLTRRPAERTWEIQGLSHFEITVPQYLLHGKIEWKTFDGSSGAFRFSTHAAMVKKIELYMQKCIIKNHQRIRGLESKAPAKGKKHRSKQIQLQQAAA